MARKAKAKVKKAARKVEKGVGDTLKDTALVVVDEVEKAGGVVLEEIRSSFEFIGGKVADTAKSAADTTVAVKDKVTSKEVTDQLHGLVRDVEEVGESLLNVITSHFDSLRKTVSKPVKKKAVKKKASKKKTAKKKTAGRKKAAVKKKPARKKAARKTAVKKKAAGRKKATVRKKPARKKATAKKKAGARKKTTTRKTARKKTARKTARKR